MSFTWEWALAIFVFLFANLFLGVQLLKLFWPLRMLKLTAKMRKEAVDPQSWLGLVADENAVRAALPIREAIFLLQKGTLSKDEVKYRKLWLRSWVYTIATLVLVYVQPQLASGSEAAMSLTLDTVPVARSLCSGTADQSIGGLPQNSNPKGSGCRGEQLG